MKKMSEPIVFFGNERIATGVTTPVREFVRMAFAEVGVEVAFKGKEEKEVGIVTASTNPDFIVEIGKEVVAVDERYYRPTEVDLLIGDASKARERAFAPVARVIHSE